MKKVFCAMLCAALLFVVSACRKDSVAPPQNTNDIPCVEQQDDNDDTMLPDEIRMAYKEFLLNYDFNEHGEIPVFAYFLLDLDFDGIPELGIHHHIGGSAGGYFKFFRYDGEQIVSVLNNKGLPASCYDEGRMLADLENKRVYFLKEMCALNGNDNFLYGYIREAINQNGALCIYDVLSLEINWDDPNINEYSYNNNYMHYYEDDYLSDADINDCLITQYFTNGEWKKIKPEEYLKLKRELVPAENSFANLLNKEVYLQLYDSLAEFCYGDVWNNNTRITQEKIDILFSAWLRYIEMPNRKQWDGSFPWDPST